MKDSQFWYWINERQRIYLAKERGDPKPWTDDKILQDYKFTNVFREQDRVTRELRKRINKSDNQPMIFWKTCLFRMFNWPGTYDELKKHDLVNRWNEKEAKKITDQMLRDKKQVFTGAYIITNSGSTRKKNHLLCEALTSLWNARNVLPELMRKTRSLRRSTELLRAFPMIGYFVGYELVTDFRHTPILSGAEDIMTWANVGPGARRGCNRIFRGHFSENSRKDNLAEMQILLEKSRSGVLEAHVPSLEMRDIEHSLCEFDKYERVRLGEGRPRSRYDGRA